MSDIGSSERPLSEKDIKTIPLQRTESVSNSLSSVNEKPADESLNKSLSPEEAAKNLGPSIGSLRHNLSEHFKGITTHEKPFDQTFGDLMGATKEFKSISEIAEKGENLELPKGYREAKDLSETIMKLDELKELSPLDPLKDSIWRTVELKSKTLEEIYKDDIEKKQDEKPEKQIELIGTSID